MGIASYITQGQQLLGRTYALSFGNNTGQNVVWGNELPKQSPLRIMFAIERTLEGPGSSQITLCNLSPSSRNAINTGTQVVLRAGYVGSMSRIFAGVVAEVKTERNGPDIMTQMTCTEGLNFTNFAVLHQSYVQGTPLYRVLQDLATAMQVDISHEQTLSSTGVVCGIPNETLSRGLVVDGPVRKSLTELCRARKLVWSIVNQQLRIRPVNHYNTLPIPTLNRDSGLINVPAFNADKLTFSCLLLPDIYPGGLVRVDGQNQNVHDFYLVCKTKTEGDTHGPDWKITCEAAAYTGSVGAIASTSDDAGYSRAVLKGIGNV